MQQEVKKWRFNKRIISLYPWGLKISAQAQKDLEDRGWTTLTVALTNRDGAQVLTICPGGVNDIPITYPPQGKRGIKIHCKPMADWLARELHIDLYRQVGSGWVGMPQKWPAEWDGNCLVVRIGQEEEKGNEA